MVITVGPVISYGRHYSGAKIGEGASKPGMEQPVYYWDPSIATSGLELYRGDLIPEWKGNFLVGGLAGAQLSRLVMENGKSLKRRNCSRTRGNASATSAKVLTEPVYVLTDDNDAKSCGFHPR